MLATAQTHACPVRSSACNIVHQAGRCDQQQTSPDGVTSSSSPAEELTCALPTLCQQAEQEVAQLRERLDQEHATNRHEEQRVRLQLLLYLDYGNHRSSNVYMLHACQYAWLSSSRHGTDTVKLSRSCTEGAMVLQCHAVRVATDPCQTSSWAALAAMST